MAYIELIGNETKITKTMTSESFRFDAIEAETNGNLETSKEISSNPDVPVNGAVWGLNVATEEEKYVTFNITSTKAEKVEMKVTIAGNEAGTIEFDRLFITYVNDVVVDIKEEVPYGGTPYTYFETITCIIELKEGKNTIKFTNKGSGAATNFGYIELIGNEAKITKTIA